MVNIQLNKDYGGDHAKAKSRELVRNTIEQTLLTFKKPEDLKALCFPGVDAAEIFEVYDSLNIPRENIVGIERDPEVSRIIGERNTGITLVNRSLEDYVRESGSIEFDIISLDYTGTMAKSGYQLLEEIRELQKRNHFVLHHANSARRDHRSAGIYSTGFALGVSGDSESLLSSSRAASAASNNFHEKIDQKKSIKGERSLAYSVLIRTAFGGTPIKDLERMLKFSLGEDYELVMNDYQRRLKDIGGFNPKHPIQSISDIFGFQPGFMRGFEELIEISLSERLGSVIKNPRHYAHQLFRAMRLAIREEALFEPTKSCRYSYVSLDGTPMIGDIYFLSRPTHPIKKSKNFAETFGFPEEFAIRDINKFNKGRKEFQTAEKRFYPSTDCHPIGYQSVKEDTRQYLGSSAKPVLTKQKAIDEFRLGATVEEVQEKYRGVNGKPLAAWKAHVTMGTYDKASTSKIEDNPIVHQEDSDLEKITKEEAIDLLGSGIPIDEVHGAYPTSFSKGQLKAYKAHITMGSYEK